MKFIKSLAKFFSYNKETDFQKYMRQAREMMKVAHQDKALGYTFAAKAAVQSAKSYRAAAHASVYYSNI